jgi:hypothetical protein
MSAHIKIGGRYRVRWSTGFPELTGKVVVVVAVQTGKLLGYTGNRTFCEVEYNGKKVLREATPQERAEGGGAMIRFTPMPEQLEPIIDDGRKVIAWEDCLWSPTGGVNVNNTESVECR